MYDDRFKERSRGDLRVSVVLFGHALSVAEEGKQRINPSAVEFIDIGTTSGELNLQFSEFASAVSFLGIAVCVIIAIAHWDYDRLFLRLTRLTSCG